MIFPPIRMDHMDVKIPFGDLMLNILYVRFGYFYCSMQEHVHSNKSYEMHFIPQGQGTLVANGKRYPISANTLFMTGPDVAHEQITNPEDPMAEYCICFEVIGNIASMADKTAKGQDLAHLAGILTRTPFWIGQDTQQMLPLFEQLAHETKYQYIGYYSIIAGIIEQIIIKLVRNYTSNQPSIHPVNLKTLDDNRLVIIESSFLGDYASITLHSLADKLGLSVRQTERTLQSHYGVSFTKKRQQARMSAAAYFLVTTQMSVSRIAEQTGFKTLEHFNQTFKKHYGITPTAYRDHQNPS
ncbi:AraC family transcriptional regulator [Paenibacillus sp. N4]|uniref:helix-turn-helix domain-containing protein n=1 Tax=Paenibacillus vietnamensis TaxID=2590547 RepID=UPI001CD17B11|nr:helix-turn-helix domain-containing protein [Paenibacillus vietnamensis]MCA0753438.1 AraC family transcriptional regulator [Paenibacillus vietnamensis]